MHRWEALVRFDPEIRAAAEKLLPYGMEWVEELGRAFFVLHEDRSYLPGIVDQLLQDAQRATLERGIADRLDAFRRKSEMFSRTAIGEATSKRSLAILFAAEAAGYGLGRTSKGAFSASIGESTTFMYSNSDIERFGVILVGRGVVLN
jgi:hypothetical protein